MSEASANNSANTNNNGDNPADPSLNNQGDLTGFSSINLDTVINADGVTIKDFVISTVGESNASLINGLENRIKEIINNSIERLGQSTSRQIPNTNHAESNSVPNNYNMQQQSSIANNQRSLVQNQQNQNLLTARQELRMQQEQIFNRIQEEQSGTSQQVQVSPSNTNTSQGTGSVPFMTARQPPIIGSTRYNINYTERQEEVQPRMQTVPTQNYPVGNSYPHVQNNNQNDRQLVDVTRWNIKFDGTAKTLSVDDFVFRVQTLKEMYEVPWHEVLCKFNLLLSGPASDWYWDYIRQYRIYEWPQLKSAITRAFRRYQNDTEVIKDLLSRKPKVSETFEEYVREMCKLRNQANSPMTETDLISLIKGNLRGALQQLLFPCNSTSLESFIIEGRRAETMLRNNNQRRNNFGVFEIAPPYDDCHYPEYPLDNNLENNNPPLISEENIEIAAVALNNKRCYNCKKEGHNFVNCPIPQRNLFCYKCGYENVVTPKCPRCSGNSKMNVSNAGLTRSKEIDLSKNTS